MSKSDIPQRFWDKVEKTSRCWNWMGSPIGRKDLYGIIKNLEGKNQVVHRFIFERLRGKIPEGLQVCHHCDNKRCVRPSHLFLGTQKDNMQDCQKKGRRNFQIGNANFRRGEEIAWSKLTPELVMVIRNHYALYGGTKGIAAVIGIGYKVAWKAAVGLTWAHLPFPSSGAYITK